jgi:hypothetical protein
VVEFLRRHSLVTLLISVILIAAGSWGVFFQDSDDLSDTAMFLAFGGFVVFCIGAVGLMIILFRPIEFSKDDAARWEVTRLEGKTRFMMKFAAFASPFLIGVFAAIWDTADLATFVLIVCLFLGVALLAAHSLWQYFQREHTAVAASANKDGAEKQLQEPPPDEIAGATSEPDRSWVFRKRS